MTFKNIFAIHGIPDTLNSDNNPLNSKLMKKFANGWNFRQIFSSPRYPQSNGLSKKEVGLAKHILKSHLKQSWI